MNHCYKDADPHYDEGNGHDGTTELKAIAFENFTHDFCGDHLG